ncbi:serine/threonine protein phosphatase 1 [Palleronia marisminoris]|uniref:Diadenosine tetraphosphatase n=1 Tax=Palleronia marisminoris TaxID=315423 RepID=A0A1Y5TR84_9RHOB|nr:metallophosphoesterase family protein [Palleronia marisminoris]SFH49928.1 serine/threonine protein phosphatase 1 [Palleronia marisminoris]SLN70250.1 diadenosine tetraphosphatase [Palleronia marisminoris]
MTADTAFPRPETPFYAIGDLHGCLDHLDRMLEAIETDMTARGRDNTTLVLLGDYVDRGEDSRGVLLSLYQIARNLPDKVVCLMGNHEKMLLDFLDRPEERGPRFLRYGGLQTLASFRVSGVIERARPDQLVSAAERLRAALPEGLEDWLRALPLWWRSGDVVCVHAAMDPAIPPEAQQGRDMLWGHPLFSRYTRPDGLWVIHGHNVVEEGNVTGRRVACDTGAYHSGRLTAAAVHPGEEIRFLTV